MKIKSITLRGLNLIRSIRLPAGMAEILWARKRLAAGVVTGVMVLFLGGYGLLHVSADTATLVPDGDTTNGWGGTGGTTDSTCASGTRCDFIDDGTTDNTADYITTAGSTAGGEVQEHTLSTVSGVSSASQIVIRIYAQTTAIGGGTADTLTVNLRVSGTLQTAGTCTPGASYAACTVTFTGTWNQANVDNMSVYIMRNKLGSGNPSGQADTINLANVYATLTYTPTLTQDQSAYRWFDNQDAGGQTTFAMSWGGSGYELGYSLIKTSDGGYAVTGRTASYGNGSDDMFLAKYDSGGTLSWSRTWGGASSEMGTSLIQTSDGGYAVTGQTASYSSGTDDMFLAKYDSGGTLSWSRTWGGITGDYGRSLIQTSDGGYAVTGYTFSYGSGGSDMFLAKYDSGGTLSWSRTWGSTGADQGSSLVQTSDGGYAVTGYTASYGTGGDMFLAKYDSGGTLSWSRTWGSTGVDQGSSLVQTSDGGYAVTGQTKSYGETTNGDMFLAKYDSGGTLSWSKTLGGTGYDYGYYLVQTGDGGYAATGTTSSYTSGGNDMFIAKYDSSGNISGCSSPTCQSPTAATTSPTAATTSPTAATTSPTAATTSPTAATTSPTAATTTIVAANVISISVGAARAAANTAMTAPDEGTIFRLRLDIHVAGSTVSANAGSYKLQYAPKGGSASCAVVPTGNFADVSDTSVIGYADNPMAFNGQGLSTSVTEPYKDPVHSTDTNIAQAYYEKGTTTFTNPSSIASGQDGMWDFALQTNQSFQNTTYCLRVVKTGGSLLDTYSVYPELTTTAARFTQAAYRWFDTSGDVGGMTTFAKAWGASGPDQGDSLVQTSDGGYAVTGSTSNVSGFGDNDMLLAKYDSSGNLSWLKTWGASVTDEGGNSLVQTSDGGYAVTGNTNGYGAGSNDMFLAKYDSTGTLSWSKTWGGDLSDESGSSVVQTSDGGYAVTGDTNGYGAGSNDMFLAKYGSTGTLSWSKTWGGAAGADYGYSLVQTSDGGYAIAGRTNSYGAGSYDTFLAKYDSTGTLSWSKTWGGTGDDSGGYSLVQTSDGGYAVTGGTASYGSGVTDMSLTKYDSTGTLSWSKTWGGTGSEIGTSLVQTSDGGYAVTGVTASYGAGSNDMFLAKYDSTGTLSWSKTWGGTGLERGSSLVQSSDSGYAITGYSGSYGAGNYDMFLAKYDSSGNISGCSSPMCQSPTVSTSSPTVTAGSPTVSTTSPSPMTDSPTAATGSPTGTITNIVVTPVPIGIPQAAQNKPLDMPSLSPMMLRIAMRVDGSGIDTNTQSFKLQYAVLSSETSCQVVSSGLYADVSTATPIAFYDDARYGNGQIITQDPDDPSDGTRTSTPQSYIEANSFANAQSPVYAGNNAMWQFSLAINNATLKGKNFCLRIAKSDNTMLTALNVADVAYAPQMNQLMHGGNWFDRGNGLKQYINL